MDVGKALEEIGTGITASRAGEGPEIGDHPARVGVVATPGEISAMFDEPAGVAPAPVRRPEERVPL
jgi:hypothetical protein